MTTYFITGGLGFLGQYIVQAIHARDPQAELRVLVRTQRKTLLNLQNLDRITWVRGELNKPETYAAHLQGVDTVIHNAALVSFSPAQAQAIFDANVLGTRHLAQAARQAGCKDFIFVSSISAIGSRPGQVADETFLPDLETKKCEDAYGYSKRTCEMELCEMRDEMRVIILNPSVILGPGSERLDSIARLVSTFPVLPMISYVTAFVDVRDVARAVVLALGRGRSGERYIVSAENINTLDFTRAIVRHVGKKTPVYEVPVWLLNVADGLMALLERLHIPLGVRRLSQMNSDKAFSCEKIKAEMGWEPQISVDQSIADTVSAVSKGKKR